MSNVPDLDVVGKVGTQVGRIESLASELMRFADRVRPEDRDYVLTLALDIRIEAHAIADTVAPKPEPVDYDRLIQSAREIEAYIAEYSTAPKVEAA